MVPLFGYFIYTHSMKFNENPIGKPPAEEVSASNERVGHTSKPKISEEQRKLNMFNLIRFGKEKKAVGKERPGTDSEKPRIKDNPPDPARVVPGRSREEYETDPSQEPDTPPKE